MVFVDNEYTAGEVPKRYLRAANGVVTLALLVLVGWRFALERAILIQRNVLPPHVALWRMPKQVLKLLGELLVCAIFVPPGVSGSFQVWEWKYYVDRENACPHGFTVHSGSCYEIYSYPYAKSDRLLQRELVVCLDALTAGVAGTRRYEVLGLLSLLRLYMLPRVIRNMSDFTKCVCTHPLHHSYKLGALIATHELLF